MGLVNFSLIVARYFYNFSAVMGVHRYLSTPQVLINQTTGECKQERRGKGRGKVDKDRFLSILILHNLHPKGRLFEKTGH